MLARFTGSLLVLLAVASIATAQPATGFQPIPSFGANTPASPLNPVAATTNNTGLTTNSTLPAGAGQVFRKYPIGAYTQNIKNSQRPQQAIIDWILRETGTDVWFSEPLGFFSADKETLTVYHTPEMHKIVAGVVDRFVSSRAEPHVVGLRLVTVGRPNWRTGAHEMLRPVPVKTPGVDAWLISKENMALLLAQLQRRSDYSEHNASTVVIANGQSHTISRMRPQNFVKDVVALPGGYAGHKLEMGTVNAGFNLQLSPLFADDTGTVDAVVKCNIDQIEKFVSVPISTMGVGNQPQQVQVQVPQVVNWRLHERFRWPADHVLIISAGVAPNPAPEANTGVGIMSLFESGPPRGDGLLFVESKGKASQNLVDGDAAKTATVPSYSRGRY
ncbi:MAG: hypothetical protein NXI22_24015 [bacterium]|nr:hypothetical protein [bacterium]